MAITVVEETRRIRCVKCTALNEYGNDDITFTGKYCSLSAYEDEDEDFSDAPF